MRWRLPSARFLCRRIPTPSPLPSSPPTFHSSPSPQFPPSPSPPLCPFLLCVSPAPALTPAPDPAPDPAPAPAPAPATMATSAPPVRVTGTLRLLPEEGSQYHRTGTVYYSLPTPQEASRQLAVFFPGDNVEGACSPAVDSLSRPERVSELLAAKLGPATGVVAVYPSRYEGPFACFQNLFPPYPPPAPTPSRSSSQHEGQGQGQGLLTSCKRLTASGEPLGYQGRGLLTSAAVVRHVRAAWEHAFGAPSADGAPQEPEDTYSDSHNDSDIDSDRAQGGCARPDSDGAQHSDRGQGRDRLHECEGCGQERTGGQERDRGFPVEVVLCGFSKGGVVLNQLVAEMAELGARGSPCRDRADSDRGGADSDRGGADCDKTRISEGRGQDSNDFQGSGRPPPLQSQESLPPQATGGVPTALQSPEAFLWCTTQVHYIDVGLNCRGAYVTDPSLVSNFMRFASLRNRRPGKRREGGGPGGEDVVVGERGGGTSLKTLELQIGGGCSGREPADSAGAPGTPGLPPGEGAAFRVCLHGTPRQWEDRRRRWVGQEKETLVTLLVARGGTLRRWAYRGERKGLVLEFEARGQGSALGRRGWCEAQGQRRKGDEGLEAAQQRGSRQGQGVGEGNAEGEGTQENSAGAGNPSAPSAPSATPVSCPLVAQNPATVFMFTRPRDSPPPSVGVGPGRAQVQAPSGERGEAEVELEVMSYFEGEKASMEMHFQVLEAMVLQGTTDSA